MNRSIIDLWVGFFVALGIAAVLFLALKVGNLSSGHLSETYVLQAKFETSAASRCAGQLRVPACSSVALLISVSIRRPMRPW